MLSLRLSTRSEGEVEICIFSLSVTVKIYRLEANNTQRKCAGRIGEHQYLRHMQMKRSSQKSCKWDDQRGRRRIKSGISQNPRMTMFEEVGRSHQWQQLQGSLLRRVQYLLN